MYRPYTVDLWVNVECHFRTNALKLGAGIPHGIRHSNLTLRCRTNILQRFNCKINIGGYMRTGHDRPVSLFCK